MFLLVTDSSHILSLQVLNCDNNSKLVVGEDDNGKFRLERVKQVLAHYLVLLCSESIRRSPSSNLTHPITPVMD